MTSQHADAGDPISDAPPQRDEPASFDITRAHPARVYDFLLGGKDNYEADREAARQAIAAGPSIVPGVRANRAFLRRAVQFLVGEAGIRQFLDIGTGLPTADNTHEVAQSIAPQSRILYVDNDPIVLAHGRALLNSTPQGATAYIEADARDTTEILDAAGKLLDLTRPVAVMLLMVLQFIPESHRPREFITRIMDALPSGSYLVISALTRDMVTEEIDGVQAKLNERMGPDSITLRSRDDIAGFFEGLEIVKPGLVPVPQWRPDGGPAPVMPAYAAVGRKP